MYNALIKRAREAEKNAYAPYSKVYVGAALLAADGRIFTGCNVENSSFGATICAERVALCKAVSEGARDFEAIAVVSSSIDGITPCGICRQSLLEFSPDMKIITVKDNIPSIAALSQLISNGFLLKSGGEAT